MVADFGVTLEPQQKCTLWLYSWPIRKELLMKCICETTPWMFTPARWWIIGKRLTPKSSIMRFNDFNPMLAESILFKGKKKKKKTGVIQLLYSAKQQQYQIHLDYFQLLQFHSVQCQPIHLFHHLESWYYHWALSVAGW